MDLFQAGQDDSLTPLAERMRPQTLEQFIGGEAFNQKFSWLKDAVEKDLCPSFILWGPPGSGKTTLAQVISKTTQREFIQINAISTGAKELREICEGAALRRRMYSKGTILFVDEIHRLNKSQQDVFLPYLEKGDIYLIGATTENPSFEINPALLSRARIVILERHSEKNLKIILDRALSDLKLDLGEDIQSYLIEISDGDARKLLNRLEEVAQLSLSQEGEELTREFLEKNLGQVTLGYGKKGEAHYDTISAFIKSIRGSDPDAGLYYLARLLESGEDPKFIARRLVILASEDVGNAEPRALELAVAGFQAVQLIGLPECAINLAQVVVFLASSPKSNSSYMGIKAAQAEVRKTGGLPIPLEIRNAPTSLMKEVGYSKNYSYAHDGPRGWAPQNFLPEELKSKTFYTSRGIGFEKRMNEYLSWLRGLDKDTQK